MTQAKGIRVGVGVYKKHKLTIKETHVAVDLAVLVIVVLNRGIIVGYERRLDELQRDGRLADAPVTNDDKLKQTKDKLASFSY